MLGAQRRSQQRKDSAKKKYFAYKKRKDCLCRITKTLHETESENGAGSGNALHESKSEVTETLHETTSELAERVARELLDGLRRAAWVR